MPGRRGELGRGLLDFAAPIGIGGIWLAFFLSRLKQAALLPQHDPGLQFAFKYGH